MAARRPSPSVAAPEETASAPLVGRTRELDQFVAALSALEASGGRILLLDGEPGIGKTAVAEAFAQLARDRGVGVAWGRCWSGEGAPDLWPWSQVIRTCIRAAGEDGLAGLLGRHAAEVTALLDSLGRPSPGQPTVDSAAARFRLLNAIAHLLERSAERAPLVVILDDLHAADPQSLLLLEFLTQEQRHRRLLVVAAYRGPTADAGGPLSRAVLETLRQPENARLALGPLSAEECGALLEKRFQIAATAEVVAALHRHTGGNPFLLCACARGLADRRRPDTALRAEDAVGLPIPGEASEFLEQRLATLLPEERDLLRRFAATGEEFATESVSESAGGAVPARLLAALEGQRLLVRGQGAARFRFAHGMLRELLLSQVAPSGGLPMDAAITVEEAAARSLRPALPARPSVFRREGEVWTMSFAGRSARLRDSRGFAYIALLLRHPGVGVHVSELLRLAGASAEVSDGTIASELPPARAGLGDSGAVLDARAKAEYRGRMQELQAEIEEAHVFNDSGRVERAERELDLLTAELSAAVGLGGRDRRAGSSAEKARISVTRAIGRAIERIDAALPELARYLGQTIRTGTFCTYASDPSSPHQWEF